ncbi:hypothetical protein AYO44_00230 [Planctomycetaceae bacterium SCGC AG-212-F19]|nr:hypothetical protein AYO44_00230 [Planctomycetaceae bacterium SCGC AG-212-F19]
MTPRILLGASILLGLTARVQADELPSPAEVRKAVERSLPFVEKGGVTWMNERGCLSCHNGAFLLWSHNEARRRGIAVDAKKIEAWTNQALVDTFARGKEGGGLDTMSQLLLGRDPGSAWREKPDRGTKTADPFEVLWETLIERQKPDGSWPVEGQLRTPPEITTMWALLALAGRDSKPAPDPAKASGQGLGAPLAKQMKKIDDATPKARDKALAFLKQVKPEDTTEALLLRVLVERKFGAAERADELRQDLLARQNPDGGWSYRTDDKESNAFATGQVLYALGIEGVTETPVIGKAWKYLLTTQQKDGNWAVTTNQVRPKSNGAKADHVYTYWGTAWATIGLLRTLPETPARAAKAGE